MANPNPAIYRTPDHWVQCKILSGTNDGVNRPKIVDWCGDNQRRTGTIGSTGAVPNGYLQASQPLDVSLCPTGQHPNVSCFSEIWRFQNPQSDAEAPTPIEIIEHKNFPCNWSFGEVDAFFTSQWGSIRDKSNPLQRWSPNSVNDRGDNTNWNFSPYVTWGVRGALLQIRVMTITAYDDYNGVQIPRFNNDNLMSLDEWKNNHSDKPIQSLDFVFYGNTGESNNTIRYATNWIYNDGTGVGISILDQCGEYNNEPFYDYTRGFFNRQNFIPLLPAGLAENYNNTASSLYFCGIDKLEGSEIRGVANPSNGWRLGAVVPYSEENYETIMKMAACFAMAFTPTSKNTFTLTDNDYYLPKIGDDGISNGDYTHGTENETNPTAQIADIRSVDYDPTKPVRNQYYDHTDLPDVLATAADWYSDVTAGSLTPAMNIGNLCNAIASLADNPYNKDFLFQEPLKNVLEYRRILLTQPWERVATSEVIPLGAFTTTGTGFSFTGYKNFPRFRRVKLGSFSFDRDFNNFLDFEPYTQTILYVPYCGVKQLPMNIFAGHTVNIYMNADNTSGVLQVLIFVDNIEWGTMTGMASEELPLVGETALTAANTKRQLDYQTGQLEWQKMIGMGGSVAGASISAANKNPAGLIAQGASALFKNYYYNTQQAELQYQINHTKPEPLTIQKGDSSIDKMNVQYPFIMIQSPVIIGGETSEQINNIKETFGHTKGFKCCATGTIGDFSGLTKCSAANLSGISCTYTEKKMILEALQEGVIL